MLDPLLATLLDRKRLVLTVAALLTFAGVVSWFTMPRQEDPTMPARVANMVIPFPGADAETVERLVLDPVEDELAEIDAINHVNGTARAGVAVLVVELHDSVYDVDAVYDDVQAALDRVRPDLPEQVLEPQLNRDLFDPESVVLMVTGSDDRVELDAAARELEDRFLAVQGVSKVNRIGDPEPEVQVLLDPAVGRRYGIGPGWLADQLQRRNVTVPGGSVVVDGRRVLLRPQGELASVAEIRDTPMLLPGTRSAVPLSEVATTLMGPADPSTARVHHEGRAAVALSVVPRDGIDYVGFGDRVRAATEAAAADIAPLQVEVFAFQPDNVDARISDLGRSLLLGVLVVAGVLLVAMGARMGLVVASVVPLVTFSSLAIYAQGGGILHQISVAALVLALGLLVDNAIVMAESVQQHLDDGKSPRDAGIAAVRELFFPLATATGTTLAAFVPMLLSSGATGDFTRAIPVVIMLTLAISWFFAVGVTPVLASTFLRPGNGDADGILRPWADRAASLSLNLPVVVLVGILGLVGLSGVGMSGVQQEFFPLSDRARMVVTLELPEGTDLDETEQVATRLEQWLAEQPDVVGVSSFIGRGAPRFYYNLLSSPSSPHLAQLVVTAADKSTLPALLETVRVGGAAEVPEAFLVARRLQQGPPVGAPVEIRLSGDDLNALADAADVTVRALSATSATDVRHDLGLGVPTVEWEIDDAWAARRGVDRGAVSVALLAQTQGLDAGDWRGGDRNVPIRVRGSEGSNTSLADLEMLDVGRVPLAHLTDARVRWAPAVVRHYDRERVVAVSAQLADGVTFGTVLSELDLPDLPDVDVAFGGEAEGSQEANAALLSTLPMGLLLLLFFLLVEFDSFRRVGIVLGTVPLAAAGVVPGLLIAGQPFGFMSLLGVIALVGIVVNNAIVLLDVVDRGMEDGLHRDEAIRVAVRRRIRPILLTTATTVAGLLPLALSSSSLWPPLAFAMISGLLASTLLTLLFVPALARVLLPAREVHA